MGMIWISDGLEGPYEYDLGEDPEDVLPYRPRPRL